MEFSVHQAFYAPRRRREDGADHYGKRCRIYENPRRGFDTLYLDESRTASLMAALG